jgi:hypothetical protein
MVSARQARNASRYHTHCSCHRPTLTHGPRARCLVSLRQPLAARTTHTRTRAVIATPQFTFHGTVFQLLIKDTKVYGLLAWMGLWLLLRAVGAVEPHEVPPIAKTNLAYFQFALTVRTITLVECSFAFMLRATDLVQIRRFVLKYVSIYQYSGALCKGKPRLLPVRAHGEY